MADINIDSFGEHDRTESRPHENIPLDPVTSLRGLSGARARLNAGFVEDKVNGLYEILSEYFTKSEEAI